MDEVKQPIVIAKDLLSQEALEGIIREFILREGTDYGHANPEFAEKYKKVEKQMDLGKAVILFDPNTETCTLERKENLKHRGENYGI